MRTGRPKTALVLSAEQREELERWIHRRSTAQFLGVAREWSWRARRAAVTRTSPIDWEFRVRLAVDGAHVSSVWGRWPSG